jgi:hypothetical protein
MVSGFNTSPKLFSKMESGDARPIVIFENVGRGRLSLLLKAIKLFTVYNLNFEFAITDNSKLFQKFMPVALIQTSKWKELFQNLMLVLKPHEVLKFI